MPPVFAIPFIVLVILACACAVYYGIVLYRILVSSRTIPTARAGLDAPEPEGGWPDVAVVIPAHNESDIIAHSARSLAAQDYPRFRVIYALDRCTDETESVLRATIDDARSNGRFEIITIDECPEDWSGKTHAIWKAVNESTHAREADALLFTDADTEFHPSLVRAAVALLHQRNVGMISLLPTLSFEAPFEKRRQPAAGFELIRQFPLDQINKPGERTRNFANGQFMLFTRDAYEAVGGHEAVREHLLEDLAFARLLSPKRAGMRVNTLLADGMLLCRMYRSAESFRKGWKRIFTEALRRRPARLRASANRLLLTGVIFPVCALMSLVIGALLVPVDGPLALALLVSGALGTALAAAALARVYRTQGAPSRLIAQYPLGALDTFSLLREAARDLERGVQTEWAGKRYTREAND